MVRTSSFQTKAANMAVHCSIYKKYYQYGQKRSQLLCNSSLASNLICLAGSWPSSWPSWELNLPPSPRTRFKACRWRDSWRYFFLSLGILPSASSLALACRLFRIRWYCLAFTYRGSSSSNSVVVPVNPKFSFTYHIMRHNLIYRKVRPSGQGQHLPAWVKKRVDSFLGLKKLIQRI